jgi:hypothetical protein
MLYLSLYRSSIVPPLRRVFRYSMMSRAHDVTAAARSNPPTSSGGSTPLSSDPNPNSKSAGVCTQWFIRESVRFHHYLAKKEAKRLEKEAKLAAKAAKAVATATTNTPTGEKKAREKAGKDEVVPFVNMTPKGQKKGEFLGRREETWSYCVWRIFATHGVELFSTERHAYLLLLQICQGPWLLVTIRSPSKPPGMIGGLSKVSSSQSLRLTVGPNPRVCS